MEALLIQVRWTRNQHLKSTGHCAEHYRMARTTTKFRNKRSCKHPHKSERGMVKEAETLETAFAGACG